MCVKNLMEICERVSMMSLCSFLGRDFKLCEAFGGWGMNGAANSSCYDYRSEDLPSLLGK